MATKKAAAAGSHKSSDLRSGVWVTNKDKERDTYVTRDSDSKQSPGEVKSNVLFRF